MEKSALVIDDDPMIRGLVKSMLEAEGYLVELAEDGKQGIEILENPEKKPEYSVIILDVVMPGLNGLDVLTRIRMNDAISAFPVLMLTGEDKAEDIMAGYNVGADYYITKPFTRQQLLYGLSLVLSDEVAL
ncbi:MAG: response regulator [Bdellovibrionota bacterium]